MNDRINSRRKGAAAEREMAKILSEELGVAFERNLNQSRASGVDLAPKLGAPYAVPLSVYQWAIEVKAQKTLRRISWFRQARDNAKVSQKPVLAYKLPYKGWKFSFRRIDVDPALIPTAVDAFVCDGVDVLTFDKPQGLEILKR